MQTEATFKLDLLLGSAYFKRRNFKKRNFKRNFKKRNFERRNF